MSDKPKPLNELELRQVIGGISQNIQQPSNAAKYLNRLLTDLNSALERIDSLEQRIEELIPKNSKPKTADKKVGALDI